MAGAESVSSQPAAVKPCTPDWALGRYEPAASHFLTLVSWSLVEIVEIWIKDILQDFKSETLSWTNIFSKSSVGVNPGVVWCPVPYSVLYSMSQIRWTVLEFSYKNMLWFCKIQLWKWRLSGFLLSKMWACKHQCHCQPRASLRGQRPGAGRAANIWRNNK